MAVVDGRAGEGSDVDGRREVIGVVGAKVRLVGGKGRLEMEGGGVACREGRVGGGGGGRGRSGGGGRVSCC